MGTERRVLVVEDHPFQRRVLVGMLQDLGSVDVVEAADGTEALKALGRGDPGLDLMICDLDMPQMDGVELLRHIGEHTWRPSVVVSSGKDRNIVASVESMAAAYGLTVLGTLGKPPNKGAVREYLKQAANGGHDCCAQARTVPDSDVDAAIKGHQLTAFYQPLVSPHRGTLVGCEALIRWRHPDYGMIPPDVFVPIAQRIGQIDRLTDIMLTHAVGMCRQWRRDIGDLRVSVNITLGTLTDVSFPDRVAALVEAHGLEPSALVLEVTERQVVDDMAQALDCLSRLRLKGFGLAIDDFGTGFASLQQLRQLPATELKIDRDFVYGAATDRDRRSILEASVQLARKLGLTVVAEGVENQADWDLVTSLPCDLVQGYFVARPMPAGALRGWYQGRSARRSA